MADIPQHIINDCKRDNRVAQKQLYYLSKDRFKRIALRYCPSVEDAKDVVQEAYLKVFRSLNSFDSAKGNFEAWSTRIVVNEAYTLLRKKVKIDTLVNSINVSESLSEDHIANMTLEEVKGILDELKADHKLVINMYFFEEFSYKEMSEILKIKESSVRSKVARAKTELNLLWAEQNRVNYGFK